MKQTGSSLSSSEQPNPIDPNNKKQLDLFDLQEYFEALWNSIQTTWHNYYLWLALAFPMIIFVLFFFFPFIPFIGFLLRTLALIFNLLFLLIFFTFVFFTFFYFYPVIINGIVKTINEVKNFSPKTTFSARDIFEKGKKDWQKVLKFLFFIFLLGTLAISLLEWLPLISKIPFVPEIIFIVLIAFFILIIVRGILTKENSFFEAARGIINLIQANVNDSFKFILTFSIALIVPSVVLGLIFTWIAFVSGFSFFPFFQSFEETMTFMGGMPIKWQKFEIFMIFIVFIFFLQSFLWVVLFDFTVWWLTKVSGLKVKQIGKKEKEFTENVSASASSVDQSPQPIFSKFERKEINSKEGVIEKQVQV